MDEVRLKRQIFLCVFLAALLLSWLMMPEYLFYDEFWSLINFAPLDTGRILTDLALPNNHPLNTLALKIFSIWSFEPMVLRLFSLISGAMIPVLCGTLAYRWSRANRIYALIAAALLSLLSLPLLVYSGMARGYTPQLFFLLLCIRAMTGVEKHPRRAALLLTAGAAGTILSVPSGALFLLPAGIGFLIYAPEKVRKNREMWISAGVIAAGAALFYGINFSALQSGQSWGMEIRSFRDFGTFICPVLISLLPLPGSAAAVSAWCRGGAKRLWMIILIIMPLLLAVFTNGGPARCYIYLAAVLAVSGGVGLAEVIPEKWRKAIIPLALLLSIGNMACQWSSWHLVDHAAVFEKHQQSMPGEILTVYRASAGYPVRCNLPEKDLLEFNRRLWDSDFREAAFFEVGDSEVNGLDDAGNEKVVRLPSGGEKRTYCDLPCRVYQLLPVKKMQSGKSYLAAVPAGENIEKYGGSLHLNPWLYTAGKLVFVDCRTPLEELPALWRVWQLGE